MLGSQRRTAMKLPCLHFKWGPRRKAIAPLSTVDEGRPELLVNVGSTLAALYDLDEELGEGASSTVVLAYDRVNDRRVAIKTTVLREPCNPGEPKSADMEDPYSVRPSREGHLLTRLVHPNIVKTFGAFIEPEAYHLVLEPLLGGDLRSAISSRGGRLTEAEASQTLFGLLKGLSFMHR